MSKCTKPKGSRGDLVDRYQSTKLNLRLDHNAIEHHEIFLRFCFSYLVCPLLKKNYPLYKMTVKVSPVATNNSERRDNQTFTPETDVGMLSHTQ